MSGDVTFWENTNPGGHTSNPWTYADPYRIVNVNLDGTRKDPRGIHFTDWDGDGKCDLLYYNQYAGTVDWFKNVYQAGSAVGFSRQGTIPEAVCHMGIGLGVFNLGLRFADIDGDGRADWLCMSPDGTTTGML